MYGAALFEQANSIAESGRFALSSDSASTSQPPATAAAPRTGKVLRVSKMSSVCIRGQFMASLSIDSKERVCLAQISNTLLRKYSYNEIHNRRVALGINCIQCTPGQLEMLREAGAMPVSSRRCGMITKKEAERLVKSFLDENKPPSLPDSFTFRVQHRCAYGCRGTFFPARYNSSRAKCIRCAHCNVFYSPNKFIFHSHETADVKYQQTGTVNFNSWRKHISLVNPNNDDELNNAWEDVKSIFNSGKRRRNNNGGNAMSHGGAGGTNHANVSSESDTDSSEINTYGDYKQDSQQMNSSQSDEEKCSEVAAQEEDAELITPKLPSFEENNYQPTVGSANPLSLLSFMNPFYQTALSQFHLAKFLPALFELNSAAFMNLQNQLAGPSIHTESMFPTSRCSSSLVGGTERQSPPLPHYHQHQDLLARFNQQSQLNINSRFRNASTTFEAPQVVASSALVTNRPKQSKQRPSDTHTEHSGGEPAAASSRPARPADSRSNRHGLGFVSILEHLD